MLDSLGQLNAVGMAELTRTSRMSSYEDDVAAVCADVNECAGQPCGNGGICRDLEGDFKCHCPSPYVGKRCQLRKYDLSEAREPAEELNQCGC